ncbi:hypothetical protein [Vibrio campbellii]|uniref:hypothetical protein n=1 Tax=Vibrio campbellii TaxID=680 RepID=UPI001F294846|nr:hypothetical protein [Vibrio campbellii]MCE7729612.1 hypothetical protein [Vibrio campbellii]
MSICRFNVDNFEYNIESNLVAMGLPLPQDVWSSAMTMSAAIVSIEGALSTKAADVPLSAISSSAMRAKQFAGISSAFYAGAIIGSAMMASKRATRCNLSELKEAFSAYRLPSWAADEAVSKGDFVLRLK